ncbi:MAG: hypothetical protein Kow0025_01680 [Thermodesulfovibrionales bacterium]
MDTIGKRLRHFREEEAGEAREKFASGLGVTPRTLERYENGDSSPDASFLTRLNAKYRETLNLDWLLTGRGDIYLKGPHAPEGGAREPEDGYQDLILERMHRQLDRIYREKDFLKLAAIQSLLNLADPQGEAR